MPTDFRDGRTYPRRGRDAAGDALWLLRAFDKARAAANRTIYDYIYPCPMDRGVFERWGVTAGEFNDAIKTHASDEAIEAWLRSRVSADAIERANRWLRHDKASNLDRQDREEGA